MPTLGKSVLPCEGAVINIGIAQCSLAELMADPLIGPRHEERQGRPPRPGAFCWRGVVRERAAAIARPEVLARGPSDC